jgi:hypothetical protein
MATALCYTGMWVDTDLRDGQVRVDAELDVFLSRYTWEAAASLPGTLERLHEFVELRGEGTYQLPIGLFTGEAEDTQRALSPYADMTLLSPYGDTCSMPHCWQDVVDDSRGFPLCAKHRDDLTSWDDLLAS